MPRQETSGNPRGLAGGAIVDRTNRKNKNHQFLLEAGEIDRITEELMKFLSDEPIDRKDALRLRFVLEETLLNYKDFCPEGTAASLRFSHSFGMIRISLKPVS